jgi:hypothetical protein
VGEDGVDGGCRAVALAEQHFGGPVGSDDMYGVAGEVCEVDVTVAVDEYVCGAEERRVDGVGLHGGDEMIDGDGADEDAQDRAEHGEGQQRARRTDTGRHRTQTHGDMEEKMPKVSKNRHIGIANFPFPRSNYCQKYQFSLPGRCGKCRLFVIS